MKLDDFVKEVNGVKTIDREAMAKALTELNCNTVENIMKLLNDSDFLVDIAVSYAITFCMLEDTFDFNFLACVNEMYMRAKHPDMLKELNKMLNEERDNDDDFDCSCDSQKDDINVQ